jgi:diguanylate cyclase (GGDEF)-like protein
MISAQSYSTAAYNDDDQYLLEMLATYAAIALENHGMFQHIQTLATTDPLTELHNRRHLFDLGERELARSRRFGRCMGVMMLDIDHFKMVNDQHGHAIGDQVLHALGSILKNGVREIDIVGRYGGEELVIVLPEANLSGATEVAERLRREIENHFTHSRLPAITVSIGIASLEETDDDFAAIVHRADLAMYRAKQAHGNLVMQ